MRVHRRSMLCALAAPFIAAADAPDKSPLVLGGVGGGLGTLRTLGAMFTRASGIPVTVIPSLGTQGGIKATMDGKLHLSLVGRSLTDPEQASGLSTLESWRTAIGFVTDQHTVPSMKAAEIAELLRDDHAKWPDGTPVRPILRPPTESDYPPLFAQFPGVEAAIARLRGRREIPIAATDQETLDLAERITGSLTSTTLAQVITELRNLRFIAVDGVEPTINALESGAYKASKTLNLVRRGTVLPQAEAFIAFLTTQDCRAAIRRCGFLT